MRPAAAALCSAILTLATATHAARTERPVPDVAFEVTAPSPRGPWTLRIANEGDRPVRVPADMRLIRLSITPPGAHKPITCRLPHPLRPSTFPSARELYLAPGKAYVERFDPRLFCFGPRDASALVEDATVRAFFGWGPDPYAVEDLAWPPATASLREIAAPKVIIGPGTTDETIMQGRPGGGSPSTSARDETRSEVLAELDERAPRLALEAPRFAEAKSPRDLVLRLRARNVGQRPMRVVLRPHMLSFHVDGPDGPIRCAGARGGRDATHLSLFRTLAPGEAVPLPIRLDEACAHNAFRRPGLYRVVASLHASDSGRARGAEAYTGLAIAPHATLVRLLSAELPFYPTTPEATPVQPPVR